MEAVAGCRPLSQYTTHLSHPHSFISSPSCDILLFSLPYLNRIERGKKRGKHPEGGRGGEEKENKDEKRLSEAVERAGCLSLP